MPGSYRAINYALRPAKAMERRMISEALRRLHPFQRVEDYRYIGFGSVYFSDFQLLHRALGITDMVSIEKDAQSKDCFTFNRPYRSIDLLFGQSSEVLPEMDWGTRTILWLDYDGKLDLAALGDIDTFCTRCASGSVLIVSTNAQPDAEPDEDGRNKFAAATGRPFDAAAYRLKKLQELIEGKIPPGTKGGELRRRGLARVFQQAIDNEIAEQLAIRNSMCALADRMVYQQFLHFLYRDGAQMLTVGGVIYRQAETVLYEACAFDKLRFVRCGREPYEIRVPCLTAKEVRHLNAQLPCNNIADLSAPGVPIADVRTYADVYRFFPSFSEILFS